MKNQNKKISSLADCDHDFGLIIGNFDGFHIGHKKLIENFVLRCKVKNIIPVALTFNPHPVTYVKKILKDYLLTDYNTRNEFLFNQGIDQILELNFEESIQQMSATSFLETYITRFQKLKYIHLGHDFKLGKGKSDASEALKELLKDQDVVVSHEDAYLFADEIVSSSLIRDYLKKDLFKASKLLGRDFSIKGKIKTGKGIGKKKLFATANLDLNEIQRTPSLGVYISKVKIDGIFYEGVTNVGINPTISHENNLSIETHLLFFNADLYGEDMELIFLEKIREEKKFNSIEELRAQIGADVEKAKKYFRESSLIKLALIGKNIAHSKSQQMYEELLGKAVNYTLIDCEEEKDLPTPKTLFETYKGVSITAPYKKNYAKHEELQVDCEAGVNALYKTEDSLYGTNTDIDAVTELVDKYIEKDSRIVLLGSGTMAKITSDILDNKNLPFKQFSRKQNNLVELSKELIEQNTPLIIINACAREYSFDGPNDFSYTFWDMNYDMQKHKEYFKESSVKYVDGIDQLKLQAKYALKHWNLI